MSCDCCRHVPTKGELANDAPVTGVPLVWRGPTPDHRADWACCSAPWSAHSSAADLDQLDRNREEGRA